MLKQAIFVLIVFALGLITGVIVMAIAYSKLSSVSLGTLLDQDRVYFSNGPSQMGRILQNDGGSILFDVPKQGTLEISQSEIKQIDENFYARFLKDAL